MFERMWRDVYLLNCSVSYIIERTLSFMLYDISRVSIG